MIEALVSSWRGPRPARRAHARALAGHSGLRAALGELRARCPPAEDDEEAPVFLLSAGWRSGSTLLQRLIMSGQDVLIWGEPYDECGILQALADSLSAFRPGWPPDEYSHDGTPPRELAGSWVANLHPGLEHLRAGHRALVDRLLGEPARACGAERWGFKEVRLTADHAAWLRWLYPNARIVLLYRNPYDAFRSYSRYGRSWYDTFPDEPVFTASRFGLHWRRLLEGFLRDADALGALLVRYEDLMREPTTLDRIEGYLGFDIDRDVIRDKVGSSEGRTRVAAVSRLDHWLLRRAVSPLAGRLGYAE